MKVREMTMRELRMKLIAPFETSVEVTDVRRVILVEVQVEASGGVVTGWGECAPGEVPSYSPETTDTVWHILKDYLWDCVKGQEIEDATDVWPMLEWVRGNNMAKAGLEAAIWDAQAKLEGVPLAKLLGGVREEIASGVSIGIKATLEGLVEAVAKELADGYQRIKIKIKPGKDVEQVKRLRKEFPSLKLMVDANSAYSVRDVPLLKQLDAYHLMMIEQPLGWDDLYGHIKLQEQLATSICLDECIHTEEQAKAAVELGACRIINIKMGRLGGHTVAKRVHDLCARHSVAVWCGGMLESGIGRAHNIALSSLANFVLPGDVSASKRYWHEDIVEPEITVSKQGTIRVPTGPGIGFEPKRELIEKLTVRRERLV
jgi:O-succinylbenzoate synthase